MGDLLARRYTGIPDGLQLLFLGLQAFQHVLHRLFRRAGELWEIGQEQGVHGVLQLHVAVLNGLGKDAGIPLAHLPGGGFRLGDLRLEVLGDGVEGEVEAHVDGLAHVLASFRLNAFAGILPHLVRKGLIYPGVDHLLILQLHRGEGRHPVLFSAVNQLLGVLRNLLVELVKALLVDAQAAGLILHLDIAQSGPGLGLLDLLHNPVHLVDDLLDVHPVLGKGVVFKSLIDHFCKLFAQGIQLPLGLGQVVLGEGFQRGAVDVPLPEGGLQGQRDAVPLGGDVLAGTLGEALHVGKVGTLLLLGQLQAHVHLPVQLVQGLQRVLQLALELLHLLLGLDGGGELHGPVGGGQPLGHVLHFLGGELDVPKGFINLGVDHVLPGLDDGRANGSRPGHHPADDEPLGPQGAQHLAKQAHGIRGLAAGLHQLAQVAHHSARSFGQLPQAGGGGAQDFYSRARGGGDPRPADDILLLFLVQVGELIHQVGHGLRGVPDVGRQGALDGDARGLQGAGHLLDGAGGVVQHGLRHLGGGPVGAFKGGCQVPQLLRPPLDQRQHAGEGLLAEQRHQGVVLLLLGQALETVLQLLHHLVQGQHVAGGVIEGEAQFLHCLDHGLGGLCQPGQGPPQRCARLGPLDARVRHDADGRGGLLQALAHGAGRRGHILHGLAHVLGLGVGAGGGLGEHVRHMGGVRGVQPKPPDGGGGDFRGSCQVCPGRSRQIQHAGHGGHDLLHREARAGQVFHALGHFRGGEGGIRPQLQRLGVQGFHLGGGGPGDGLHPVHLGLKVVAHRHRRRADG